MVGVFNHECKILQCYPRGQIRVSFSVNIYLRTIQSNTLPVSATKKFHLQTSILLPTSEHTSPPPPTAYPPMFQFPATLILLILHLWCSQAFHLFRCWCPWCLHWHGTEEAASQGCRGQQEAHEVDASHGKGRL